MLIVVSGVHNCRIGTVLYLSEKRRVLGFNERGHIPKARVGCAHVVVGKTEFIRDKVPNFVFICLLKAALVELNRFVLYTLLEREICVALKAHSEHVLEA